MQLRKMCWNYVVPVKILLWGMLDGMDIRYAISKGGNTMLEIQEILNDLCENNYATFANEYAEPDYDNPKTGILFCDWNDVAPEIQKTLEEAGYILEWYDEWVTCYECGRAIRTIPDSYSWLKSWAVVDCSFYCKDCILEDYGEEYIDEKMGRVDGAVMPWVDLSVYGFTLATDEYYGFNGGIHPQTMIETRIEMLQDKEWIFQIDWVAQFDVGYSLWIRPKEEEMI